MRITMVGGGYVGLVSAACLAEFGNTVRVVETDPKRLSVLAAGGVPIHEPRLDTLMASNMQAGRLTFGGDVTEAVNGSAAVFLAVGTPPRNGDGHANLDYLFAACEQVAAALTEDTLLVTKSTVPVGTGRRIGDLMRTLRPDITVSIASNPEFLREGSAILDFMHPDRVVIGLDENDPNLERSRETMHNIYRSLFLIETTKVFTSLESAELGKYAANAFLAMKVSFINEMADLCEVTEADVHEISRIMGLDNRIGRKFLHAGPGFGGSCFPKDTLALSRLAHEVGAPCRLVDTTIAVNADRKQAMTARILADLSDENRTVAILGLTFKQNTDDMRDAPSIGTVAALTAAGATVRVFDPVGMTAAAEVMPDTVVWTSSALDAATGADIVVVMTEWNEFRAIDPADLKRAMRGAIVHDLRNVWEPSLMRQAGFHYRGIGRR